MPFGVSFCADNILDCIILKYNLLPTDNQGVFIVESGVLDLHHQVALPRLGLDCGGGGQVGPGEGLHRGGGLAPGDQGREGGEKAR